MRILTFFIVFILSLIVTKLLGVYTEMVPFIATGVGIIQALSYKERGDHE